MMDGSRWRKEQRYNELTTQAWQTANIVGALFGGTKVDLESLLIGESKAVKPAQTQTQSGMEANIRMLHAAFGGKVIENG
jgi:hypothetical protein